MGGVSTYSDERAEIILERVANGEFLAHICRDEGMPGLKTVYDWRDAYPDFALRLARARDIGQEYIEGDILRISDSPAIGMETEEDGNGQILKIKRADALAHRKLQIETRLKMLMIWNPKKYAAAKRAAEEESGGGKTIVYNSPSAEEEGK